MPAPWPYKLFLLCIFAVLYCVMYIAPNFHPVFVPMGLPITALERHIPLMPWTVLIYTSDYLFMALAIVLINEPTSFHRFARQAILVLLIGGTFFWFLPTSIARGDAAVEDESRLIQFLLNTVRNADAPTNCFPSLHIGFAGVALWNLRDKSRAVFGTFLVWGVLIALSVLTTKQHYLWDIAGGIGLVIASVHLDRWLCKQPYIRHWLYLWEGTDWWDYSLGKSALKRRGRAA